MIGLVAGQVINGTVHVNQHKPFEAHELTVGLYGLESTWFRKTHRHGKSHHTRTHVGTKDIIQLVFPI